MVAISLYKGNLHKVPDAPRRWPLPTPKISLKDFKVLLHRRARALSRLRFSDDAALNVARSSSPSPSPSSSPSPGPSPSPNHTNIDLSPVDNVVNNNDGGNHVDNHRSEPKLLSNEDLKEGEGEKVEVREEEKMTYEREDSLMKLMEKTDALVEEQKNEENVKNDEKSEVIVNPVVEKSNTENAKSDAEKRKKEVKEKLEILNEKKHSLVQVLKQILNAEEELKRHNNMQGMSGHPPLQVNTTTDSGSMTKVNTPRMGSDGNPCGDMEGVEAEDVSNHNMPSHHLPRMSSTSPSSDSQQRKPASSVAPHSYRTTLGVAGSPSRFAPGGQGHSSVSLSGTSYIASSPSPAASVGTSVFRDAPQDPPQDDRIILHYNPTKKGQQRLPRQRSLDVGPSSPIVEEEELQENPEEDLEKTQ